MAIYDLARGGYAPEYGNSCKDCGEPDENGLPKFLQPDHRDGYRWRDKRDWTSLMHDLDRLYNKDVTDLKVGDKLRLFLNPNHADVKAIMMDFRKPVAGFKFRLVSVNGADYSGDTKLATYSQCGGVESMEDADRDFDTGAVDAYSQYRIKVTDGYNAKVDAIDLEIIALPKNLVALQNAEMQFSRRYEMDGYMMP